VQAQILGKPGISPISASNVSAPPSACTDPGSKVGDGQMGVLEKILWLLVDGWLWCLMIKFFVAILNLGFLGCFGYGFQTPGLGANSEVEWERSRKNNNI